ncbi:hypothetical protein HNQ59_001020 [Chitinivorax tropicus]|uniref:DUF4148 domain-containing protein n=1 Tax=Chitinivorax tropicus TaxID=714531 RepID=A0A840MH93_9PROT|nr:hypothetical protein [Chitinivorax tropicus]MBB5017750.1 hypothetical protein [Chitinivorax tropicus]
MKPSLILALSLAATLAACSNTPEQAPYDDDKEYITGSNIPRRSSAIRSPEIKVGDRKAAEAIREAADIGHRRITQ